MKGLKKTVAVIGHFAFGEECADGQTVKTKIVTEALSSHLGAKEILKIDTAGGKITLFKSPFQVIKAMRSAKNVLIFPAHNGLRIYVPLLSFFSKIFRKRHLHYAVIGGWLPRFLQTRKRLAAQLKSFDGIYVETETMKKALEQQGFSNIFIVPNCKELMALEPKDIAFSQGEPYKLCTFSRVMREKGIEDAVLAVKAVNEKSGRIAYTLDIYGPIDPLQTAWFEELRSGFPAYVCYGGCVPYDKSVETLKQYFALLFPTRYYTEGIPGTIIDAYAAGVPVISSEWESFSDLVEDGVTGLKYGFNDSKELVRVLTDILSAPEAIDKMRYACLEKSRSYTPAVAVRKLTERMS